MEVSKKMAAQGTIKASYFFPYVMNGTFKLFNFHNGSTKYVAISIYAFAVLLASIFVITKFDRFDA